MNRILLTFCAVFFSFVGFSQNKGNPHFFKLLVTNEKNEIMVINWDGEWEIPGTRYRNNTTINECLEEMAKNHGITVKEKQLGALITFHHEVRDLPTMMFYYEAKYDGGELTYPSWESGVKWVTPEEAYKIIPFKEMNYIIKSIIDEEDQLHGAFTINYNHETRKRIGFEIIEELKKM